MPDQPTPRESGQRAEIADWLRSQEEAIRDRMRGLWRDSSIIRHEDFDTLVMAVVIEVAEDVRRG